jgi:hypothetical protein
MAQATSLSTAHVRALLRLLEPVLLQSNALDRNEASRVHWAEVVQCVHRRLLLRIQLLRLARSAEYVRVALVQLHAHLAVDSSLGEEQAVLDELALGAEVHAVVELVAPVV